MIGRLIGSAASKQFSRNGVRGYNMTTAIRPQTVNHHAFFHSTHKNVLSQPILGSILSKQFNSKKEKIEENEEDNELLKSNKKKPNWRKRKERAMREFMYKDIDSRISDRRNSNFEDASEEPSKSGPTLECTAYCTAEAYDFPRLYSFLQKKSPDVSITSPESSTIDSAVISRPYKSGEVFYFEGGSMVCWGLSQVDVVELLQELKDFEVKPVSHIETESMDYAFTLSQTQMHGDVIYISNDDVDKKEIQKQQLAFSYGLHQSVRLAVLEDKVANQIRGAKDIQEHLVMTSRWWSDTQTKKTVNRMLSNLLSIRGSLNLHSELLGTPDIFWDYPELEHLFLQISKNLEISTRIAIVNKRLDESHLVLELLKTELTANHSSRLEMLIIYLITIEVVLGLIPYVMK